MTRPEEKAEEMRALRAVLERVDLGIPGIPKIDETESPDFRLTWPDGRVVGVEVAEVADQLMAAGMGAFAQIERQVLRGLADEGLPAQVHLHTRDGLINLLGSKDEATGRRRADPTKIAAAILTLVREQIAGGVERGQYFRESREHMQRFRKWLRAGGRSPIPRRLAGVTASLESRGIEYLDRVGIYLNQEPGVYAGAGHVGRALSVVPQHVLDRKTDEKLPTYRVNLPGADIWIILVAGRRFASGVPDMFVEDETFTSGFDRVFFVDVDRTRVFRALELRNARAVPTDSRAPATT